MGQKKDFMATKGVENQAAIIAVGSELTAGQITNRNAAWISERLFSYGIESRYHLTVDDRIDDILAAFRFCSDCRYIFCTGGLGPTSDDITRDAVAKFTETELEYHEPSWARIDQFFTSIGRQAAESNRQQCYFPAGSDILTNDAGTANAFAIAHGGQTILVLPGPPREIERVWTDHLHSRLEPAQKWTVRKWRTIGKGESELTAIVDEAIRDAPEGCEVAYRASAPYIEIKLKHTAADEQRFRQTCRALKSSLLPWLYEEDDENVADILAEYLERFDNSVVDDTATQGHLSEMLGPALRRQGNLKTSLLTSWDLTPDPETYLQESLQLADDSHVALGIAGFSMDNHYAVGLKTDSTLEIESFALPYESAQMMSRNKVAIAGLAMKTWVRWLAQNEDLPHPLS